MTPNVRLVRQLAEGAMGSVWMAENVALDTHVAVKFIAAEKGPTAEDLHRFQQEAKAAAQIRSRHVVRTFDYGVMDGDVPFIVLELLEGESLQQILERRGRLSIEDTVEVVSHVSRALEAAHACGIVHRDVKPANVFRTVSDGDPVFKLLDFGVAKYPAKRKRADGHDALEYDTLPEDVTPEERLVLTLAGTLVGTPHYMSPEQVADDGEITPRVDVWALAVVTYQCLTGQLPFRAADVGKLSMAIMLGEFTPPSELAEHLDEAADELFRKAFARDEHERFGSVVDFVDRLRALREPAPESSPPPQPSATPPVGTADGSLLRPAGLAIAALAGAVVAVVWWASRSEVAHPAAPASANAPPVPHVSPTPEPIAEEPEPALPSARSSVAPIAEVSAPPASAKPSPASPPKSPPVAAPTSNTLPPRNLGF